MLSVELVQSSHRLAHPLQADVQKKEETPHITLALDKVRRGLTPFLACFCRK